MAKKVIDIAAVIDIGSSEIRFKLAGSKKGALNTIEAAAYPLNLGHDTFTLRKISPEKVNRLCEIIRSYKRLALDYGVVDVTVVATSSIREAENMEYILNQVFHKTGLDVRVIDSNEEKYYIYKLMYEAVDREYKQSALMVYIGSGNLGVSYIDNEKIPFIQNVKIGALRLNEMFERLQDYSNEFHVLAEEYLSSFTDFFRHYIPTDTPGFIASGSGITLIAELCGVAMGDIMFINRDRFQWLYDKIKTMSFNQISTEYDIGIERAEIMLSAMSLYNHLLNFTTAEVIVSPNIYLIDSILFELLLPEKYSAINKAFYKNTAICAKNTANRFGCNEAHYLRVEGYALKIFDKIKKIQGMGQKERVLLQAAAILHDVGKAINGKDHHLHSFNIIKGLDIIGLDSADIFLTAAITLYHSHITPKSEDGVYGKLRAADRVVVSKLAAILRIAEALDRSHILKFDDIDVRISEDTLVIGITTDNSVELEEWSFKEKSGFFEDVFGMKTVLKKKRMI